jgi:hypothetical protein
MLMPPFFFVLYLSQSQRENEKKAKTISRYTQRRNAMAVFAVKSKPQKQNKRSIDHLRCLKLTRSP